MTNTDKLLILYSSDMHGSEIVFQKIISAAIYYKVNYVFIGGDVSGKTITPILVLSNHKYKLSFMDNTIVLDKEIELDKYINSINNSGSYSILLKEDLYKEFYNKIEIREKLFLKEMKARLNKWIAYAKANLEHRNIGFIIICGNDDHWKLDDVINESNYALNPDKKAINIFDFFEVIGESGANITPFNCPRDMEEDILYERIKRKLMSIRDMRRAIFIFHAPPYDSGIDIAPEIGKDLKPVLIGGHVAMKPVGSKSIRRIIEEYQPMLSLHGHIHESPGVIKIGKTLCMNPGSEYSNGIMHALLISLDNKSVKGYFPVTN